MNGTVGPYGSNNMRKSLLVKTSLDHLPENKQGEIHRIVELIEEIQAVELIILFGSYARGDWVEELSPDGYYFQYQSDFDILVIVETRKTSAQESLERDIEERISRTSTIKTPVSVIVHDIDFVNRRLAKAQYFFSDIKKEGVLLYDSGRFTLKEPRELDPKERQKLAEEDFKYWFNSASSFFVTFQSVFDRGDYSQAAFLLHQVTERLYGTILLVFTRYKPSTHDLKELRKFVGALDQRLITVFPLGTDKEKHLFQLLRKAYVDARYKPSYKIERDELLWLRERVEKLRELTETLCKERIASFML